MSSLLSFRGTTPSTSISSGQGIANPARIARPQRWRVAPAGRLREALRAG
jgi:hypothetical protein